MTYSTVIERECPFQPKRNISSLPDLKEGYGDANDFHPHSVTCKGLHYTMEAVNAGGPALDTVLFGISL